jgi:5-methylcytosine-specific restriction endonuclease McrA
MQTVEIKNEYDTLCTGSTLSKPVSYYIDKWRRKKGIVSYRGNRVEKFRQISRHKRFGIKDIINDEMPDVFESEYHWYRWHVGHVQCVYCGCSLHKENKTQDHVIPKSRGGSKLGRDNLEPACKSCNWRKGDRSLLIFLFDESHE